MYSPGLFMDNRPLARKMHTIEKLNREFWRMESAEAMYRTSIDVLLNDRLGMLQNHEVFMRLDMATKRSMTAELPGGKELIVGEIDYVAGYGPSKNFVSSLI